MKVSKNMLREIIRQELLSSVFQEQLVRYPNQQAWMPLVQILSTLYQALESASQSALHFLEINGLPLESVFGDLEQMGDLISLYRQYEDRWREQGRLEEERQDYINIIANLIISIARKLNPYRAAGEAVTAITLPDIGILPSSGGHGSSPGLNDLGQAVVDFMNWILGNTLAQYVAEEIAEWMLDNGSPWTLRP